MKKNMLVFFVATVSFLSVAFAPISLFALEETGGLGMKIAQIYDYIREDHRGSIVVLDVFKGGSAEEAGVLPGDIITHIDGELSRGKNFRSILSTEIRGEPGEEITLKVWRSSSRKRIVIKMIRVPMIY